MKYFKNPKLCFQHSACFGVKDLLTWMIRCIFTKLEMCFKHIAENLPLKDLNDRLLKKLICNN